MGSPSRNGVETRTSYTERPAHTKRGRGGPKSKISAIAPSICVHRIATHDLRRLLACNGFSGIVVANNAYAECIAAIFRTIHESSLPRCFTPTARCYVYSARIGASRSSCSSN